MNDNTRAMLKGVSTLKLGVEYKPVKDFSLRLGYNYLSPMFKKDAYRDGSIESYGSMFATSTDYTNWDSTNRFTFGLGYNYKKFFFDAAFQYSQTNGDFYPFMSHYPIRRIRSINYQVVELTIRLMQQTLMLPMLQALVLSAVRFCLRLDIDSNIPY